MPSSTLGLPPTIRVCLFDLDGVLTRTTSAHAAAWKATFDEFLRERAARTGEPFVPFDAVDDYAEHVDGKRRLDGVRSSLASRGITLPEGALDAPPGAETVCGLGSRKRELLLAALEREGVDVYDGSARYVRAARDAGLRCAVVSSSASSHELLGASGLEDLFDVRIDAVVAERGRLRGKPAPDTFVAAAAALGVDPAGAA